MPLKRSSKRDEDEVTNAFDVMAEVLKKADPQTEALPVKNPAAVALGRLGGLKGGRARADKLSKKRRTEIAKRAINARWAKHKREQVSAFSMISKMFGRPVSKATLVSNLARYAKAKDTFRRSAPNVYGLIDNDQNQSGEMFM